MVARALKGWAKATNTVRKRLLRCAIKEIAVADGVMKVTFWMSADEVNQAKVVNGKIEAEPTGVSQPIAKLHHLGGLSAPGDSVSHEVMGSYIGGIGGQAAKVDEPPSHILFRSEPVFQAVIDVVVEPKALKPSELAEFKRKIGSFAETARALGVSKEFIRATLSK